MLSNFRMSLSEIRYQGISLLHSNLGSRVDYVASRKAGEEPYLELELSSPITCKGDAILEGASLHPDYVIQVKSSLSSR